MRGIGSSWLATQHHMLGYRRTWRGGLLSSLMAPLLFLTAIGGGLGAYVNVSFLGGLDYIEYVAPGLAASAALTVTFTDSTWPVFSAFNWTRLYDAMAATSLGVRQILVGHLTFVLIRTTISALAFLAAAVLLGAVPVSSAAAVLGILVLLSSSVAGLLFAVSAVARSDTAFQAVFRLVIVPLQLFSGVFFPIEGLPGGARLVIAASPFWHAVEASRAVALGPVDLSELTIHLGYLAFWAALGFLIARHAFTRRLYH